jgi:hypothetical protein
MEKKFNDYALSIVKTKFFEDSPVKNDQKLNTSNEDTFIAKYTTCDE